MEVMGKVGRGPARSLRSLRAAVTEATQEPPANAPDEGSTQWQHLSISVWFLSMQEM